MEKTHVVVNSNYGDLRIHKDVYDRLQHYAKIITLTVFIAICFMFFMIIMFIIFYKPTDKREFPDKVHERNIDPENPQIIEENKEIITRDNGSAIFDLQSINIIGAVGIKLDHNGLDLYPPNCGDNGVTSTSNTGIDFCACIFPYYGAKCENQVHDPEYLAIGDPVIKENNGVELEDKMLLSYTTDDLNSRDVDTCTLKCDESETCKGVYYKDNKCTLFDDIPEFRGHVDIVNNTSTFFIKKGNHPKIMDKVFIYPKGKTLPLKWWNIKNEYSNVKVFRESHIETEQKVNAQYKFNVINPGRMTGVWSNKEMSAVECEQFITTNEYPPNVKAWKDSPHTDKYEVNLKDIGIFTDFYYVKYF